MKVALAASKVASGGTARFLTEIMLKQDKRCTSLISLVEYAYTALLSSHVLLRPRQLPLICHLQLLLTGVGASVLSNWCMESDVPVPIRLVLKNGQLSANMAVGALLLGRRYSTVQILAIMAITAGIVLATAGDALVKLATASGGEAVAAAAVGATHRPYGVGVGCMVGALLLRASRGALQERAFGEHGVCASEVIFAQHVLGLPVFASDPAALRRTLGAWGEGVETVNLPLLGAAVPLLWLCLAGEVVADHLHKLCTTRLVGATSALTSTLVSTMQRLLMVVLSATVFATAPATPAVWAGIALVGLGCVLYALSEARPSPSHSKLKAGCRVNSAPGPREPRHPRETTSHTTRD